MSGLNTKASNDQIRLEWQGVTSDATANKSYKTLGGLRAVQLRMRRRAEG